MFNIKTILLSVAGVTMMGALTGCGFGWTTSYIYENGDKYTAGNREISDKIESIDLDYLSGDVTLTESDSDKFTILETSKKELSDVQRVHTWVDGGTLYVKYAASAKRIDMNFLGKKLVIGVPKGVSLSNLDMHISSGDVDALCSADNVKVHASSGDIKLDINGDCSSIDTHASSGDVDLKVGCVDKVNVSVSSGKISINGENIKDLNSKTSSGSSNYTLAKVPEVSSLRASSGDITISLPKDADLSADLDVSSGKVSYDLAFAKNGDNYVAGSGANQMKVHTSSGDIRVKVID